MPPAVPNQRTLLCILDWGLGHASRSLALAQALEAAGEAVFFASCGRAKKFIEQERPGTIVYELPAYNVTYPTRSMPLNVALQLPRWLSTIWRERRCSAKLVEELRIDRIVSDNRFGCYVPGTPSIFLTHQLHPITNSQPVSWLYRKYLQRVDGFWVPDYAREEERVSGKLSYSDGYVNVEYIGPLSRLRRQRKRGAPADPSGSNLRGVPADPPGSNLRGAPADPSDRPLPLTTQSSPPGLCVMALLSGPEPMRTQLENIVIEQLLDVPGQHVLVRGLPGSSSLLPDLPDNIKVHDFADAELLITLLPAAKHIVCRSGYSTLMDVYAVTEGSKLILVPTPGQTEQIYLAEREARRVGCRFILNQEKLRL